MIPSFHERITLVIYAKVGRAQSQATRVNECTRTYGKTRHLSPLDTKKQDPSAPLLDL